MNNILGDLIKIERIKMNLSQSELAHIIGVPRTFLSRVENGRSFPRREMFDDLIKAFNGKGLTILK